MTATQHPDHDGRGLPIFHEDGSTNTEALASLAILAAEQDLVLVPRHHLQTVMAICDERLSDDALSEIEAELASFAVIASNPVSLSLLP